MACVAALFVETIIQGTSDHLHKPHSLFNEVYFEEKAKASSFSSCGAILGKSPQSLLMIRLVFFKSLYLRLCSRERLSER